MGIALLFVEFKSDADLGNYLSRVITKPSLEFPIRFVTNRAVQPQKMARVLNSDIKKEEGMYYNYLCSENKDVDLLP